MGTENQSVESRLDRLEAAFSNTTVKQVPPYLSENDMIELLRCSRSFLRELIQDGFIPAAYKLRGKSVWKGAEVIAAVENSLKPTTTK